MNALTGHDDLLKTLLLENILPECENKLSNFQTIRGANGFEKSNNILEASNENCQFREKYRNENGIMECSVEDCNSVLNFNKQIISSLLDLKRHVTFALEKCEKKLKVIETSLQKQTVRNTKVLIRNAGIPYFKDRDHFCAPNNEDEILQENQNELQLRNVRKVDSWAIKERDILLKAIEKEATTGVPYPRKIDDCTEVDNSRIKASLKVENEKRADETFSPVEVLEMIGPLHGKEFDWFQISSIQFDAIHSPLDCRVMWNSFVHPDINKNVWTKSEDIKLRRLVKKLKFQNWDKISKDLNTNRTAYQCFIRYNTTKKLPKVQSYIWKEEEDERLLKLVEIFKIGDFIPWGEVANWIKNRTKQQAYFRWTYSLAPYLTKGRFTIIEDRVLKDAVIKYGTNFRKISAALMPNRSTVQLHDRYQTLTSKQIENCNVWTFAEDSKLLELFARFGPNWSRIAKAFSRKTRTQLRHRHAALQRYIKRGISLFQLHRSPNPGPNKGKEKRREEESRKDSLRRTIDPSNRHTHDQIDRKLFAYFQQKTRFIRKKSKLYSSTELTRDTKNLYAILQRLNAKLRIPDNVADLKLSERDQQLVRSLKEYTKLRNDKKRYFEVIDKFSLRMFGPDHNNKGGSHFIPLPPFDSQIKLKRSPVESKCIDYNLNRNDKFLLEKPVEMVTADFVISHIGGYEKQLQFQKFTRSLRVFTFTDGTGKSSYLQPSCMRPRKTLSQPSTDSSDPCDDNLTNSLDQCRNVKIQNKCYDEKSSCTRQTVKKNYTLFNIPEETGSSYSPETEITSEKDVSVMEATHATISCFRNLENLIRSSENYIQSNQCFPQESCNFREAVNLLETRLEQLFRYPIGLSETAVPNVYAMDTMEDTTSKRKSSEILQYIRQA